VSLINIPSHAEKGMAVVSSYLQSIKMGALDRPMFRGHASKDWELKCSAFREGAVGIGNSWQLEAWIQLARRFVPEVPRSPLRYLVLAQHYGIPTNLLDWTSNPLIALFFASLEEKDGKDGVVLKAKPIFFNPRDDLAADDLFDPPWAPVLIDAATMNTRSLAQDSWMTLHSRNEEPITTDEVFVIRAADKPIVRAALGTFGVSMERVYADLGVAAAQFREGLAEERTFQNYFQEIVADNRR